MTDPMADRTIRVLVADDQSLVRGALVALLDLESDLEVVAEAGSGDEVVEVALRARPDVALLDIQMPGRDGIAVAAELKERLPSCRVIMCTTFARPGYLVRAMDAGAVGFIVKDVSPEDLLEAVRRVYRGLRVIDPALAAESVMIGPNPLTAREREVLASVDRFGTISEMSAALHLTEGTIRNHLSSAIGKTAARTRAEAFRIAEGRGWLT
ncbi:MAG: two-component system, NarL family, response regulator DesR [Actinomycetota bacterium]|nr:two-component system, NarL family, response regulator DesR [Actinomycetota bacterium]